MCRVWTSDTTLSLAHTDIGATRSHQKEREKEREREKSAVEKKFYSATIHKVRENNYKFRERREREGGSRERRGVERKREREREGEFGAEFSCRRKKQPKGWRRRKRRRRGTVAQREARSEVPAACVEQRRRDPIKNITHYPLHR